MDDNSIMPFGKYKGVKLANVPDSHLAWLMQQVWVAGELKQYLEDNRDVILSNAANEKEKDPESRGYS